MKNTMQKILIALIGIATISSCSAQEKRPNTGTAANETAEVQAQPAVPAGPTELWNGFFAGMRIDEATEKAKEILKPREIRQIEGGGPFFAAEYQVIIERRSTTENYYISTNNFGTPEHTNVGRTLSNYESVNLYLVECSEPLYKEGYLYFVQGRLVAVKIGWKGVNDEDLKSGLVKQYGQPRQTITLIWDYYLMNAWQTNSKYICLTYFDSRKGRGNNNNESTFVDKQWFDEVLSAIEQKNREEAKAYKEKTSGIKF